MIPVPGPGLVLIVPEKLDDRSTSAIAMSEIEKDNARKLQNRGTIFAIGDKVEFWEEDDFVSFTRPQATEIKVENKVYFSVHQSSILCKFEEDGKE
jgi:co-chaperonin GroES (HSP10)